MALDPGVHTGIAMCVWDGKLADVPDTEDLAYVLRKFSNGAPTRPVGKVIFAKAGMIPCFVEVVGTADIVRAVKVVMKRYSVPAKNVRVVIEQFVPRPGNAGRVGKHEFMSPSRVTAGVMYGLAVKCGLDVEKHVNEQTVSNAKGVITNDRLRRWGFWRTPKQGQTPHERDALRHLLLALRRLRQGQLQ